MQSSLKQMDSVDLINLDRLAHIIKGLSQVEVETLEILLDKGATDTISESIKELEKGERISISEW
jgi:predicted transcriptional regulator